MNDLKTRHKKMANLAKVFGLCLPPVNRAYNESEFLDEEIKRVQQLGIAPDVETVTEFIDRVSIVVLGILG